MVGTAVAALRRALAAEAQRDVQSLCQQLIDALAAGSRCPRSACVVLAQRPSDDYGELHGLYEPEDAGRRARITVWMRTARRQQVVAFRSFLRTLVHEWCHHLDYELYRLPETFHTEGFYKRESTLANASAGAAKPPKDPVVQARRSWPRRRLRYNRAALRGALQQPARAAGCQARSYSIATALVEPCTAHGVTRTHSRVSAPAMRGHPTME